ncbi:hypothetical protein WOLCODRAFT_151885 [Wolfiporia cocos MD-104 SS10]|uniref:Uncharacterized protein n=1 Tax=Wolfiporia cocos (strain MD-104) TaxID=742152 RepID=A0A2H3JJ13_WOLCO|nr:hypothetical protein WOLCODRAFT_151885 [Wolfiporia cocos MD-104 SS10]
MSDNQLMNTANRMIACAVAALRAAPKSMEGEDYTQWQTKFMEELAFNMGNFPYKVFELGYRLPELYGSMVAEYTQVRNDGEEFNKIRVHEGDTRIASIKNLAPTVDSIRPLPVVEDLGPNQWWTADNTLTEAEGSSTTQHATKKRGQEDSEEESTEKEGGKDDGSGGDEEEDNGCGGSEDDQQGPVLPTSSAKSCDARAEGQVGLQAQLEALQQVAMGVPLATSTTMAPAPLTTSVTVVPSLPAHLVTPPPMSLMTPPPMHLVTPPDAPHMPNMTLTTSMTVVPSLPTCLAMLPPTHLVTLPPVHSAMPPDAPDVPDVALMTATTVAPAPLANSATATPVLSVTGNSMTSSTPASVVPPASEHAPMNDATDDAVHNEDVSPIVSQSGLGHTIDPSKPPTTL